MGFSAASLSASYLGDALGDLVRAAVALPGARSTLRVTWQEEPGEFRWILEPRGSQVLVRVVWFDDWGARDESAGAVRLEASCEVSEFQRAVAMAARSLLAEWGADGYREQWVEHDFPLEHLTRLEATR